METEKSPPYPTQTYSTNADYGLEAPNPSTTAPYPPAPPPYNSNVNPSNQTAQMSSTTVVIARGQPKRIFSKYPTELICQHCNALVVTEPRAVVGSTAWLVCFFCIIFGLWLGCCLIPFCIDACKDFHHDCPNCKKTIEIYKPL